MRTSSRLALAVSILGVPLFAACSEPRHGANGTIDFVPDQCGNGLCSLDDKLSVDGQTDVYLDGIGNRSVAGLHIESSDPSIAEVSAEDDRDLPPRVTLIGNSDGTVELLAVDGNGEVVDWTTMDVRTPDNLQVDLFGQVDGPHPSSTFDDLYNVPTGTRIDFDVTPMAAGESLMGKMKYTVVLDTVTYAAVDQGDDIASGKFSMTAPAGEHTFMFGAGGAYRTVHLSVK